MIAAIEPRSTGGKPHESALSGLAEGPLEPGPWEVDLVHRLAVHLDPALGDQAPRLACRPHAEVLDEKGRQVDGIPVRKRRLGHLLGRLVLAHHMGEMLPPSPRALLAVPARDDPPRK